MKIKIVRNAFRPVANRRRSPVIELSMVLVILLGIPGSRLFAQMKTYSNRLEGTRVQMDALEDFTILAIHRSSISFSPQSILSVRYYLPDLQDNHQNSQLPSALFLQAVELQDSHHYFMSAKTPLVAVPNSYNLFGSWRTQDVLDTLSILPSNLGVLAGLKISGRTVYLPVDVYSSSPAASFGATVYLLTGSDLQKVVVTVSDQQGHPMPSAGSTVSCKVSLDPDCVMFKSGSTVPLVLNFAGLPANFYQVNVEGKRPETATTTSIPFVIYFHQ
jgi:hypothetical protein